jgi:hypothetical protein
MVAINEIHESNLNLNGINATIIYLSEISALPEFDHTNTEVIFNFDCNLDVPYDMIYELVNHRNVRRITFAQCSRKFFENFSYCCVCDNIFEIIFGLNDFMEQPVYSWINVRYMSYPRSQ